MANLYDAILEGWEAVSDEHAIEYARAICGDWETTEQTMPKYYRYIDTVNGINVYYDYGADYYFFEETGE